MEDKEHNTICPNCHSKERTSKGYRAGTNIHRYICKSCGRNYTESVELPSKIQEEVNSTMEMQKMKSIQLTEDMHNWLSSQKLCRGESFNGVIERLREKIGDLEDMLDRRKEDEQ